MKANSFGLKELWQGKKGYGIREPGGGLFKILTLLIWIQDQKKEWNQ